VAYTQHIDDELMRISALPPAELLNGLVDHIRRKVDDQRVLAAVSGGVDSTVATLVTIRALGHRVTPIFIDTGFMRLGEPEQVKENFDRVSETKLAIVDMRERFYSCVKGIVDAEQKRLAFRETFYSTLKELAQRDAATLLVQGTIAPDWIETTGGIKTQHNVLSQLGVSTEAKYGFKLLEPLAYLYKDQVRALGKHLGLPDEFIMRQPFPGPGLLVRVPGEFSEAKLRVLRRATRIVEEKLAPLGASQWFAAIFNAAQRTDQQFVTASDNWLFTEKVTGVKGDVRAYGGLMGIGPSAKMSPKDFDNRVYELYSDANTCLRELMNGSTEYFRLCIRMAAKNDEPVGYSVVVRAVKTSDFMTADVLRPTYSTLKFLAEEVLESEPTIRDVYYDVTPKPPATIEYE
jgi:GMP synthase (glutamine-hydrolysing)